ncbi:MAG: hypothetical protein ABEK50_16870 [bacterium]
MQHRFTLGVIKNPHIEQLEQLMDYACDAFQHRPTCHEYFKSIAHLLHLERQRRDGHEDDIYDLPWSFDADRFEAAEIIPIRDFLERREQQFRDSEPPVGQFFTTLRKKMDQFIENELQEQKRKAIKAA